MKFLKTIFYFFLSLTFLIIFFEIILNMTGFFYKKYRKNVFMPYEKIKEFKTIITMGDSHTYGGNVKWNETYPYLLWKKLNDAKINTKIINAAACEENSSQLLYKLKKILKENKPEILIVLTGSSDFWNLIDPLLKEKDDFFINLENYESLQIELINRIYKENNFIEKSRVFKFFRILYLNIQAQKIISNINKEIRLSNEKILHTISSDLFSQLFKKKKFKEIIDYSLEILRKLDENSIYFSQNLSLYFAIAIAYQLQSNYTASDIYNKMIEISKEKKSLNKNNIFLTYLNYFKKKDEFEKKAAEKLKKNLNEIVKISEDNNIKLILLTYPSHYKIANSIIREIATRENIKIIDIESHFKNIKNNKDNYLEDDEHLSLKGHNLVSEILFKELSLWN